MRPDAAVAHQDAVLDHREGLDRDAVADARGREDGHIGPYLASVSDQNRPVDCRTRMDDCLLAYPDGTGHGHLGLYLARGPHGQVLERRGIELEQVPRIDRIAPHTVRA